MQLVGQKATNGVYTTFCSLSCTAMSVSWFSSGVTVTHTRSTGVQVAAPQHHLSEVALVWAGPITRSGFKG